MAQLFSGELVELGSAPLDNLTNVPRPPTSVTATAGNAQATVSWAAPTDTGGLPLTGFSVTSEPGASP